MDDSPHLRTRPVVVGDGIWCSTRWSNAGLRRPPFEGYCGTGFELLEKKSAGSTRTRLVRIWKKVVREKRRLLKPAPRKHESYDPYTYAQNFDQGLSAENLARSFSARFALPSSVMEEGDCQLDVIKKIPS